MIGGATFDYRVLIPIIARIIRKYVFLEINEYPFVTRKNGSWKLFIEFFFFRFVVPWYNGFIVISEHLAKEIDRYKVRKARIIKIPILSELQELSKSGSSAPCSVPYIIHAGSMIEQKDGIIGSLKAFAMARRELEMDIYYLITGDPSLSPDYDIIKRFIQDEGLEGSVVFTGYLDKNELSDYLHHASLAIVNKSPNKQNEYCFATKISEYIAFGIPMILTRVGEVRHYFTDGYNALIVEPDDVVQLAKAIVKLFSERALVESLASNALKLLAKDFNTDYNGARLKDFLAQNSNQY
ncbi:MAG TPA: glycosyltransferase family 4 protein [Spirochaetota bacterium]|nr:glycosyltransferase family 4 protein [Spirochaetota bacterium]